MDAKDLTLEIATKLKSDGLNRPVVYSPEALKVLRVEPVKTAWGWDYGRPIYNRLPMISEAYQKSYDLDHAAVYLDPTIPIAVGPGTLEVVKDQRDWHVLDVQSGVLTWEYGELTVDRLRINTSSLDAGRGLQDGVYQVGYRLNVVEVDQRPKFALAFSDGKSLSGIELAYDTSGDTPQHRAAYALSDLTDSSWWPNAYNGADGYTARTHYTLDFLEPTDSTTFRLNADESIDTAQCALYASEDAILWRKRDQQLAQDGSWTLDAQGEDVRYYRFHFWDGKASIQSFNYVGQGNFRDKRTFFPETNAEPYIENMFDVIEGNHILLATFTIKGGTIHSIDDKRRVTYEKYQPVADWLTKFEDEQLRCRFDDVVRYAEKSMAPPTAYYHYYEEMDDTICWGLGEVTLGDELDVPTITYPVAIELIDSVVEPTQIDYIVDPVQDGDLVTPPYAQTTLQDWSMDNGLY